MREWERNTDYRMAATKSRFRDWGRNWDLSGKSGEYAHVDWVGP